MRWYGLSLAVCAMASLANSTASAQQQPKPAQAKGGAGKAADKAATPAKPTSSKSGFRAIVPGVEHTIMPDLHEEETYSVHDVVGILATPNLKWTPKLSPGSQTLAEMATGTVFRRKIWGLEFTFKPVRMVYVDVPQATGKMQRKLVWYMVYHVKNSGGQLTPVKKQDGTWVVEKTAEPVTFDPQFVLEASEYKKAYLDRLVPVAIPVIQQKEDPKRKLLSSVEIAAKPIPVSTERVDNSVWGVATWEDLDPRIDYFSVYIQGLTNAYKWTDPPVAQVKASDPPGTGSTMTQKTLVLHFWRPGDEYLEHERIIQYGAPDKVDYSWVYR
jgi:hypothetical protein